jgi:hypothetical protein
MFLAGQIVLISAIVPLAAAAWTNRSTSLNFTIGWAVVAWAGWLAAAFAGTGAATYAALAATGCAGVSVFGARRPGAAAWNFVVLGLLIVLLLPLAEAAAVDAPFQLGMFRTAFLAVLIGTTVTNYLPTRLGPAAVLVGLGAGWQLARMAGNPPPADVAVVSVGLAPWVGFWEWAAGRRRSAAEAPSDRLWRAFRDRYGLVWGLRLRDQFDRAAANAGLPCELRWTGLRGDAGAAAQELLESLMRRFG